MAKEKKKKSQNTASGGKRKTSRLLIFFLVVGSLAMIIAFQMTYVLFVVGMIPSFVAYYVDRTESHSLFHTVMPCNLSGVLPYVVELIANGNQTSSMQMMISDMTVVLLMYTSAALGWILVFAAPYMAKMVIHAINNRHIARVRHSQQKLMKEWGPEVARNDFEV